MRLMLLTLLLASSTRADGPRVAVLPLQAVRDATAKNATWIEGKLHRELAGRVRLVTGKPVVDAMAALGVKGAASCDTACLVAVGKHLGVDRVVGPWLSLEHHFTKEGTAWVWHMEQVDVASGRALGTYEKTCLCPDRFWDDIAGHLVERLVSYDPAREPRLPPGAPKAEPSRGPRDVPGMVYVPAGPFIMGTDNGEWEDEAPRHLVELSAYFIDVTEVTNAAYAQCAEARKCPASPWRADRTLNQPTQPVAGVNWYDAVAYCRYAGKRLPTEAEWEKAARGTDEREYPWGSTWNPMWLNHKSAEDGFAAAAPVGSFKENKSPYGALDMAGNLWEWTADVYAPSYFRKSPVKDPQGPRAGPKRAMRGGSWMYDPPFFHTAHNRSPGRPDVHKRYVGFRCAKN